MFVYLNQSMHENELRLKNSISKYIIIYMLISHVLGFPYRDVPSGIVVKDFHLTKYRYANMKKDERNTGLDLYHIGTF